MAVEEAEQHRRELHVHCYRMLGSYTEAEDAVQETMLRAWRRADTYEGRSTYRAWLYKIATNVCLDLLAKRKDVVLSEAPLSDVPWLEPYPDQQLPEELAVARETIELAFLAVIQHLPARQRAVLVMRDVLGWPAEETAETLEMTVPSVKSALQRGRATLRKHLPERRSEWAAATEPSAEERVVLKRFVEASMKADMGTLATLLREDAIQAMPPSMQFFPGRRAILDMWAPVMAGQGAWGEWRARTTTANRMPAVANYVRRPGEEFFTAVNLDVLRIEDGLIAEITTFGPETLPAFGLPERIFD
ncbi:RNA polymerase subunit sigma-70 [Nonomuraea endophytica]|uniref:RNA polymerase sigma-70 factor (ECF subfamily) n=1 Tax=Nonomuraea endophytica TaxID=714136 RepID=A0A7W8EDS8_9ACTN|nr:RNA polymerase subunit sigma-70 [Nonomuraea endophytica]MBB5074637.1 RNA polymerase sigma-70 factor (ECF subfamily) [Nonomuraea endophytica]